MDFLIKTEEIVRKMKKYDYTEQGAINDLITRLKELYKKHEKTTGKIIPFESKLPQFYN